MTKINAGMFSCNTDVWGTPKWLYSKLNTEFNFTLDPCADPARLLCPKNYCKNDNGIEKQWRGEVVFMNPPYSECNKWVEKAYTEVTDGGAITVVCLLPARTCTEWFNSFALLGELRFIRGRLRFGETSVNAPFPSIVVVFAKHVTPIAYHWLTVKSGREV